MTDSKKQNITFILGNIIFFVFLFSCSSTPESRFDFVEIPDDVMGIVHGIRYHTPEELQLLEYLGVRRALTTFSWNVVEPEKDKFDFSFHEAFVEKANAENIRTVAVLGFQVPWLYPDGKPRRRVKSEHIPDFLNYVENTVSRFKGRVDAWSIWNEPNLHRFWKGTDGEFYELTKATAEIIRKTDPDAEIIGGAFFRIPKRFIKKMHKADALNILDGVSVHPYGITPRESMKLYDKLLDILDDAGVDKPIWITEVGYPNAGVYPSRVSLEKYPSHIVKTLAGLTARGPRTILWYQLYDRVNKDEPKRNINVSEMVFGLAYPDFEIKDGAHAYSLCARFLPGSRYEKDYLVRDQIPKNIVSYCYLNMENQSNTLILWNDRNRKFKAVLDTGSSFFIHDISSGINNEIQSGAALEITNTPLFITWEGDAIPRLVRAE